MSRIGTTAVLCFFLVASVEAQTLRPIGQVDLVLRGVSATVDPLAPVVPKNTASGVRILVRAGQDELTAADVELFTGGPFQVEAELAGPGLRTPLSLPLASAEPSADPLLLALPGLTVAGDYSLTNLRLTVDGSPVLDVSPSAITVKVIDQILITSVTTRPLTLDELRERGIVLDSDAYLGFEFTLGLALESEVVDLSFPVVFDDRGVVVPQPLQPPPDPSRTSVPSTVVPLLLQPADGGDLPTVNVPGQGEVPIRIPSVLVIPGNVGFLKQHFSAMLFVANGAPGGSGLVVREVQGTIQLPPGADQVPDTSDDPLSLPDTVDGPQPETLPVRGVGLDGQPGTADDLDALAPTEQGQAEFVLRGEQEGFHEIEFDIAAVLDGLVTGPVEVSGKAMGGVLVRNPFFDLSFTVPAVVRNGEPFKVFVTVTNISKSLANDVSVTLDASRLSGARQIGELSRSIDTLRPQDAAILEFELEAERTGQVVADYLRFDTASGTTGDLRFTLAVGERGVPLSPDTLVLPSAVDRLPSTVVAAAMRVLGQGWSLANAPSAVLPEGVVRTSREVVTKKALALAEAGLRVELGQPLDDAVRDVAADFYGEPTDAGFDQLLRETEAGRDFDVAVGAALAGAVTGAGGLLAYEAQLAALAASGPDLLSFAVDGGAVRVRLIDGQGRESLSGDAGPFAEAQVGGAALLPVGASLLGLVAAPDAFPYTLELAGVAAGAVDLAVSFPRSFGPALRGSLQAAPVAAGGRYRVRIERTAQSLTLASDANGDGVFEGQVPLLLETLAPQGPRFLSATVIGPETLAGAGPFGFHLALLFDRAVGEASAAEVAHYQVPDNQVQSAKRQLSGRLVFAKLARPEGPYVPSQVTAAGVLDLEGTARAPLAVGLGSRLEDPGAVVSGTVREADGTPVAAASVVYAQNPNLGCVPPLGEFSGLAAVATGIDGRYELRYVRQDACGMPFKLSTRDPASGAVRSVTSSVRAAGEHIVLDITRVGKGAVEGTVRDLSGNPVAAAQVLVVSETDPQTSASGRSAIDGRYRVEGVAVGTVRVTAVLGASLGRAAGRLDRAGSTTVVDVTLDGGTVEVSGRVLKVEGGTVTPVPGLEVIFRADDGGSFVPVAAATTSSAGEYLFQAMPTGPFKVTAALNSRDRGEVAGVASAGDRLTGQDVLIEVPVGATVRGEVRLPDGGPAAGAVVSVDNRGVLAGADGSFAIPGVAILPLQPQTVEARSADGRRTGRASVVVGSPLVEGVVVVLSRLGSAELTVLDSAGQPLAGQQVALLGSCFNPCGCLAADSGADGRVRFDDLPLGSASFRATRVAPGFIDQVTATVPLTQEGVTVSGVLRFGGVGAVSGTVLGPDGEPSFGADVALTSQVFNPDSCVLVPGVSHRVRTDESGAFRFTGVNVGAVSVTATHPFFPTAVGAQGTLVAAGDEVSFDLQLVDTIAGELSGTVFLPDGETPAGAGVEVTANGPLPDVTVATDGDGGFRFARILPQGTYDVTAQDPATGGTVRERLYLQSGQDSSLDLRLKGKGTVRVRVVDVGGDPVETAFVRLQEGEYPRRVFEAALDASSLGVATFGGVFEGPVAIEVSDPLGRGGRASTVLPRPGDEVEVVVPLTVTGTVRGRFLRPDGVTPVPFGAVTLSASGRVLGQATTAGSGDVGAFRFEFVPAGPVRVEAEDPLTGRSGFALGSIEQEDQELVLDVVAQGLGTVTGLVTHNGEPQAGAHVDVFSGTYRVCTVADADGRYLVEGVPEGRVVVSADLGGGFLSGSQAATLTGDGTVLTINVALRSSGEVTGRVLRFDGTPPPLSVVTAVVGGTGGGTVSTTTGPDGSFRLERVPAGPASLTAEVVGGIDRGSLAAEVPGGGTVDVAIVLVGTGAIDGQTLDSSGLPVAGEVTLRGTGPFPYTLGLTTGPDGRLFLPEVLAGPVTATLRVASGPFVLHGTASGAVVPGETNDLVVQVQPSGTVAGLVLRSDGATPAFGAEVTLRLDPNRGSIGLQVGPDGRFSAAGVPLGPFTVEVSDPITTGVGLVRGRELTVNGETLDVGAVVLDDTPVEVESVTPADGAIGVPVDAEVMVTFSDPLKSAAGVSVLHGGGALPLTRTLSADERTVTLIGVLPDSVELTVVAGTDVTDVFGRHPAEVFTSRFRTVDLKPPAVAATVPENGALEVDPAIVVAVSFDEPLASSSDPASVIAVNGPLGPVTGTAALASPDTVSFTPAAELAGDAVYTVTVAGAVDASGNVQAQPFLFSFATPDTQPPALALEEPEPDGWVATARPLVRVSATDAVAGVDIATAALSLDGEAVDPTLEPDGFSVTPEADLADGRHEVAATVADRVGNVGALVAGFGVDTVAPSAATVEGLAAGQVIAGTVAVGAAAEDATSGVAELRLFLDGDPVATLAPPFDAAPVDTTGLAEGVHAFTAQAVDVAGNVGPLGPPVAVVVDNQELTVTITAPAAGAAFNATVLARVTVSEAVDRVDFRVGSVLAEDAEAPYEAELDLAPVAEGPADLTATAFGPGGETAAATVEIVVDRTPPAPPNADLIAAEHFDGDFSRLAGGAGAVEGDAAVEASNVTAGSFAAGVAAADGSFLLQVRAVTGDLISLVAVDAAGNRSEATEIVVVDAANVGGVPLEGLRMWVRADEGVTADAAGAVETWTDQSEAGNDLVQTLAAARPSWVQDAANGQPVIRFDGADDVLDFSTRLTAIRTVFWVVREDAAATDDFRSLLGDSFNTDFFGGATTLWHPTSSSFSIRGGETYVNGTLVDGSVTDRPQTLSVISLVTTGDVRADNFSRDRGSAGRRWWGDLAELIVYDRPLSAGERIDVESYLAAKYLPPDTRVAPPAIDPDGGTFSGSVSVKLATTAPAAEIRYTTDGTPPTAASALYVAPFAITETTTVKAAAFRNGVAISGEAVATLTRDDELPLSTDGLALWLRADAGLLLDAGGHVLRWADQSALHNDAAVGQLPLGAPVRVSEAANGQPVIRFDGADDVLAFSTRLTTIRTVFWVVREDAAATDDFRSLLGDSFNVDFFGGSTTLWHPTSSSGFVRGGETYVNGTLVDGSVTDRPQTLSVISLVTTGEVRADNFSRDRGGAGRRWWGDLAELIVFDRPLSAGERIGVESYLAAKYLPPDTRVAPPAIDPDGGTFSGSVSVKLATTAPAAEIRYTTDGTPPTAASALYVAPFAITETTTVKAAAFRNGVAISGEAVATLIRDDEVPLSTEGLLLWLKTDAGLLLDAGGHVLRWADQSALHNDAAVGQLPLGAPVRVSEAANGQPMIRFDGADDVLAFSTRLTTIRTVFWVVREDAAATDDFRSLLGDSFNVDFFGGSTTLWHPTSSSGFIRGGETYVNGTLVDGSVTERPQSLSVISLVTTGDVRADNFSRDRGSAGRRWWGDLAELIVYDRPLSDGERIGVEGYLAAKYRPPVDRVAAPAIDPNGGTFSGSVTVTLTTPAAAAEIRYTTDGSAPDASSALYTGPFTLTETTTVKAAVFRGGVAISTATAAALIRDDEVPISSDGLSLWLRADAGLLLDTGDHVLQWADQSGRGNDAAVGHFPLGAPVRVSEAANGRPVIRFDGTDDVLAFTTRLTTIRTVFWVVREDAAATDDFRSLLGDSFNVDFFGGSTTLWHPTSSSGFVRDGETYVNGTRVDGTVTDRPQSLSVISLVTTGDVRADNFSRDRGSAGRRWWGDLAELIVYDRPLSQSERFGVELYLTEKYRPLDDAVPPLPRILAPGDGDPVLPGDTLTVEIEVSDDNFIDGWVLTLDGEVIDSRSFLGQPFFTGQVPITIPADALPGETFSLRLEAFDFGGNVAAATTTLTVVDGGEALTGDQVLDASLDGQDLLLGAGTFTVVGPLAPRSLTLLAGARVTGLAGQSLDLTVAEDLYVAGGASIDVSGLGFDRDVTYPGATLPRNSDGGGSHLGRGGNNSGADGSTFGNVYRPREPGGGGRSGNGDPGGGVARIVAGSLTLSAATSAIRANGVASNSGCCRRAGAGGSVWITAGTISGEGTIEARGGDGRDNGGSGGGGAIAVEYASTSGPVLDNLRAWGGSGSNSPAGGAGTVYLSGPASTFGDLVVDSSTVVGNRTVLPALGAGVAQAGSGGPVLVTDLASAIPGYFVGHWVEVFDAGGTPRGTYRIAAVDGVSATLEGASGEPVAVFAGDLWQGVYRFDRVSFAGSASLVDSEDPVRVEVQEVTGNAEMPQVFAGQLTVAAEARLASREIFAGSVTVSGTLTQFFTPGASAPESLRIEASQVVIEPDGAIDVSGRGFDHDVTYPGATLPRNSDGGGSHLGRGGNNSGGDGSTFGSVYRPREPGGGGRSGNGDRGGGAVRIVVDSLTLGASTSAIRANGVASSAGCCRRAGAGGSVWITAAAVSGEGTIEARGGDGRDNSGSGGGGAIAVEYASTSGSVLDNLRAWGGSGSNSPAGGAGTVYLSGPASTFGDLVVDSSTVVGNRTILPALGAGVAQAGSGGPVLVTDLASVIPGYFAGHWVEVADAGGTPRGIYRIAAVDGTSATLEGASGEPVEVFEGDLWQGVYRFDRVSYAGSASLVDSDDPVLVEEGQEVTGNAEMALVVTGQLTVAAGGTLAAREVFAGSVTVSGTLTQLLTAGAAPESLRIEASQVVIEPGGAIDVSGRGFDHDVTYPGATLPRNSDGGGSHLGRGGNNSGGDGSTFGSVYRPREPGGGGRSGNGDRGGGAVRIVADSLTLGASTSAIRANGVASSAGCCRRAGAGGSVWITAAAVSGEGTIEARGGDGRDNSGSGGGGAIAVEYASTSGSVLDNLRAWGGSGSNSPAGGAGTVYLSGPAATYGDLVVDSSTVVGNRTILPALGAGVAQAGSGGSVLVTDLASAIPGYFAGHWVEISDAAGTLRGTYRIAAVDGVSATLEGASGEPVAVFEGDLWQGMYRFDRVSYAGSSSLVDSDDPVLVEVQEVTGNAEMPQVFAGQLTVAAGGTLASRDIFAGSVTVSGTLTQLFTAGAAPESLRIEASQVVIEPGGAIDVSGRGFDHDATYPGATLPRNSDGGGSHLGRGGNNSGSDGSTFGSVYRPREPGGGGRSGNGDRGGGAVRIVADSLTLGASTSAIRANGVASSAGCCRRAGAGGSVWITTGTVAGEGTIEARGGDGRDNSGSGGGGAIAVEYASTSGSVLDNLRAPGGSGSNSPAGGAGTVYLSGPASTFGDLVVDNNGVAGLATELPALGSGVAQAGSGGDVVVTDRASGIPPYFAGHWVDLTSAGGDPKGTFRVAGIDGATLTLESVDGGVVDVVEGDLWQGVYFFDSVTVTGAANLTSVDPILP